jgi:hypothetical protein
MAVKSSDAKYVCIRARDVKIAMADNHLGKCSACYTNVVYRPTMLAVVQKHHENVALICHACMMAERGMSLEDCVEQAVKDLETTNPEILDELRKDFDDLRRKRVH